MCTDVAVPPDYDEKVNNFFPAIPQASQKVLRTQYCHNKVCVEIFRKIFSIVGNTQQ